MLHRQKGQGAVVADKINFTSEIYPGSMKGMMPFLKILKLEYECLQIFVTVYQNLPLF